MENNIKTITVKPLLKQSLCSVISLFPVGLLLNRCVVLLLFPVGLLFIIEHIEVADEFVTSSHTDLTRFFLIQT